MDNYYVTASNILVLGEPMEDNYEKIRSYLRRFRFLEERSVSVSMHSHFVTDLPYNLLFYSSVSIPRHQLNVTLLDRRNQALASTFNLISV